MRESSGSPSKERTDCTSCKFWIPFQVESVTSLQSGPIFHRPLQVHAEEPGETRDLDPCCEKFPPPNLA